MSWSDAFVGGVAIVVGTLALLAAATNWEAAFQFPKARSIEARFGRRTARVFYAMLGIVLVLLGIAIAAGFGPNAELRS